MVRYKLMVWGIALFLIVLSSCAPSLDKNSIKEAIELGKNNKFDASAVSYKFSASNYEPLTIYTPYSLLAFSVALKAKEYEELTQKEMDEIINADNLNILVKVEGISSYEVEQAKAVIKEGNRVIKSETSPSYPEVDCSGSICTWWGVVSFTFPNFSSIKNKQVKFVLILDKGEREYNLDMSKYK